jgi:hypothetical protein
VAPNESSHADPCIAFSMVVADAFDGAVRLLGDAQRFGFRVRAFHVDVLEDERASISITIAVPPETNTSQIRSRLARHPNVISLEAACRDF